MLTRDNLYAYQKQAARFVVDHPDCALWLDMGLGKTVSTLTGFVDLLDRFDATRALVVAPKRVALQVWTGEVAEWGHLHGLNVVPIVGSLAERVRALKQPADIHTINREQVPWLESLIIDGKKQIRRWPWDLVVLDEAQSFKSQSSKRWKSLRRLRKFVPRLVELTGTPSPNGYGDLWAQIFLLDRGERLGHTETAFHERWFNPPEWGQFDWTIKPGSAAEIQEAIKDIVLTMRAEDYLDLPPVKYNRVKVQLSGPAMDVYRKMARTFLMETLDGATITAQNAAVCRQKLLQLANGAIYTGENREWEPFHNAKLEALEETLEFLPTPVLIGYGFRHDAARIASTLSRVCGTRKSWCFLDSEANFEAFASGTVDYAVAHPASMGHGLNKLYKSGAENAVWFGLTDNLEFYQQFNARLTGGHRRMGRHIAIHHLLCEDTQDEGTFALLTQKDVTQEDLKRNMVELARRAHR